MNPQHEAKSDEIAPMSIVDDADKPPSLTDRLLTAIFAPIAFGLTTSIVLLIFWGFIWGTPRSFRRHRFIEHVPIESILIAIFVIPAIIGFALGMAKFTTLFGHFFYTNSGDDQHIGKTIFAWASLFLTAYVISRFLT